MKKVTILKREYERVIRTYEAEVEVPDNYRDLMDDEPDSFWFEYCEEAAEIVREKFTETDSDVFEKYL